jgi:hypothetical protein
MVVCGGCVQAMEFESTFACKTAGEAEFLNNGAVTRPECRFNAEIT